MTKYYVCGLRPVYCVVQKNYEEYFAFQWETGKFKEDMKYNHQVYFDPSGDVEEVTQVDFDTYVKKLKEERGL